MIDQQARIAYELLATAARLSELANQMLESQQTATPAVAPAPAVAPVPEPDLEAASPEMKTPSDAVDDAQVAAEPEPEPEPEPESVSEVPADTTPEPEPESISEGVADTTPESEPVPEYTSAPDLPPAPEVDHNTPMFSTHDWLEQVGINLSKKQRLNLDRIAAATCKEMLGKVFSKDKHHIYPIAVLEQASLRMGLRVPDTSVTS